MSETGKIIETIKRNRISTTEVADALGKKGALPDIYPVNEGLSKVGRVRCIFASHESNYAVHEQVRKIEEHEVAIVFTHECKGRAILGDLVAKYVLLYKGAEALIVNGRVRDVSALKRERFPVWSLGYNPIGCFNRQAPAFPEKQREAIMQQFEGGIAVCDDGGVVVIPPASCNKDMLERLEKIELQEDIWFFCLDTLKWDTKKIVCDKEYLNQTDLLSLAHKEQLEKLDKPLL